MHNLPISRKIALITTVTSAIAILLVTAVYVYYQSTTSRAAMARELTTTADMLGTNLSATLLFDDRATAEEMLRALRARPEVAAALVRDAESRLFASYRSRPEAAPPTGQASEMLEVSRPIALDGERIGTIHLFATQDVLRAERRAFLLIALSVTVLAAVVTVALSLLLQRIISRPIVHLAQTMQTVSRDRNYTLRAERLSNDELGALIDGFNDMLGRIHAQHQELELYRSGLERQVAARTAELSEANVWLRRAIEELEAAKSQAEAASEAKSRFLAGMSHELRTPLNAIIGFSEVMRDEMLGPLQNATYQGYVRDIHSSGTHLLAVISDILDIARIEAGRGDLQAEPVDVAAATVEAIRLVAPTAQQGAVGIEGPFAEGDIPLLLTDKTRLRQILLNLLSNAVKFNREGGTVRVEIHATDGLAISVHDDGIGIAANDIPKVLLPFGQVEGAMTRRYQGVGLGLSLTRAIVELHQGSLHIESQPGVGTTVTAWFPPERTLARKAS